jgi:TonB family protein
MPRDARFWRNVTIIAVAHIAIIIALVRWNRETRKASSQSIVWMSGEVAAIDPPSRTATAIEGTPPPKVSPSAPDEQDEASLQTPARSNIQLPNSTPSPTPVAATPSPKRTVTLTPVPKASVKPTAKPTPKPIPQKTATAKATPKPSPKKSATPSGQKKTNAEAGKESVKVAPANADLAAEKSDPTGITGAARSSEFSWYGKMLHDRFYSEWIQPTTSVVIGAKMSALVRIRIEKDGRVSKFTIVRPSGNVVVDESVAAVAKRVTQVDSLPKGLGRGAYYEVNINFELNPEQ